MRKLGIFEVYGIWGVMNMIVNLIRTKILFSNVRIIRFPIEIRGKKHIDFGVNLTTGVGCRIEAYPFDTKGVLIKFGNDIEINDYVHIAAINSVCFGNNILIASRVFISDIQHGSYSGETLDSSPDSIPKDRDLFSKPVNIEDNVWIGEAVSILAGVTIGKGTIIGSNSVVTKSLPPYVIAVGAPAKPVKKFNFDTNKWEKI